MVGGYPALSARPLLRIHFLALVVLVLRRLQPTEGHVDGVHNLSVVQLRLLEQKSYTDQDSNLPAHG